MLHEDLQSQMGALAVNNEKTGDMVTALRMDKKLREQFKKTMLGYENFVAESKQECEETKHELTMLEKELEKQRRITHARETEKALNEKELNVLGAEY